MGLCSDGGTAPEPTRWNVRRSPLDRNKVPLKPAPGMFRGLFQCARLFEQMPRARHHDQFLVCMDLPVRVSISFDNCVLETADDEQRRDPDPMQPRHHLIGMCIP